VTPLIAAHAVAATFAVFVGALVIRHRPRGDLAHRRLGRVWFAAMYFTVLSSFGIKRLTPGHFSWIHGLSIFTFCTLTLALYGARTHNVALHRGNVLGSYFGLVGAGIAASAFPVRAVPQLAMHRPLVLAAAVIGIAIAAVAVARAVTRRRESVTLRRLPRFVHWGMTRGAQKRAYDDSTSRGRVDRNPDPVPDRRRDRRRVDGAHSLGPDGSDLDGRDSRADNARLPAPAR
jgi:uncharacterized membrane protein